MAYILSSVWRFLSISLVILFLLVSLCLLALQTKRGKQFFKCQIEKVAKKQGLAVKINSLEGNVPFQWKIDSLEVSFSKTNHIFIKKLDISLSLWSLLQNKFIVNSCKISSATWQIPSEEKNLPFDIENLEFPQLNFQIKSLQVKKLRIENPSQNFSEEYKIRAWAKYRKKNDSYLVDLKVEEDKSGSLLELHFGEKGPQNHFQLVSELHLRSLQILKPFYPLSWDSHFSLHVDISGQKETWNDLVQKVQNGKHPRPIHGKIELDVDSLTLPDHPLFAKPFKITTQISVWPDRSVEIPVFHLQSSLLDTKIEANLSNLLSPQKITSTFKIPDLSLWDGPLPFTLSGKLEGNLSYQDQKLSGFISSENLELEKQLFLKTELSIEAAKETDAWKGVFTLSSKNPQIPITASSSFTFGSPFPIHFENLQISSKINSLQGDLKIDSMQSVQGSLACNFPELSELAGIFYLPKNLEGSLRMQIQADPTEIHSHLVAHEIFFDAISSDSLDCELFLRNPFSSPELKANIQMQDCIYKNIELETFSTQVQYKQDTLGYISSGSGMWKEPCSFALEGNLKKSLQTYEGKIEKLQGTLLKNPFSFAKPWTFSFGADTFATKDFLCNVGSGYLALDATMSREETAFEIEAKHMPIDYFSLFTTHLRAEGFFSLNSSFLASEKDCSGHAQLLLEKANLYQQKQTPISEAKGSLHVSLENRKMQILSHIAASPNQFFDMSLTIPMICSYSPFKLEMDKDSPLAGKLEITGNIEEIFDFINLGSQRIAGEIGTNLLLFGSPSQPKLQGDILVQKGSYENYLGGSYVKDAYVRARAQNTKVEVLSARATDESDGTITAGGEIFLEPSRKFPYSFTADLRKLSAVKFDHFQGNFSGDLSIKGNLDEASLSGNLFLPNADITIPDRLPYDVPDIAVTYVNMPTSSQVPSIHNSFPFHMQLHLRSDKKLFVIGRGLHSEWEGELDVSTENEELRFNGSLDLLRGTFNFAGKTFSLSKGEILFSDKNGQSAFIDLQGNLNLPDLTVIAVLRGSLLSPQLTFQSIPPLPTSSILAKVLFGKDISEITALQAIQLAQTIITLSGTGGMDVLETIRKSLGLDRFNIISAEKNEKNPDEIFVEIGKYIVKGVMITLTQGATSSKVTVEVELKNGFILQGETDQNQEGRFSLKWNYNY